MKDRMRKMVFTVGALTALWLVSVAGSDTASAKTCEDLLNSNTYTCQLKNDRGDDPESATFKFTNPGSVSEDFDLNISNAPWEDLDLACECKAKGSFKNPTFGGSTLFHCVTVPASAFNLAVDGKAGKDTLTGQMVDDSGTSRVYQCTLDTGTGVLGQ